MAKSKAASFGAGLAAGVTGAILAKQRAAKDVQPPAPVEDAVVHPVDEFSDAWNNEAPLPDEGVRPFVSSQG